MKEDELQKSEIGIAKGGNMLCNSDHIFQQVLSEIQDMKTCFGSRLTSLELKVSVLNQTCNKLFTKLESLEKMSCNDMCQKERNESIAKSGLLDINNALLHLGCNKQELKVLPLTSESDYPNGSWLGDPKDLSKRVRCKIDPGKFFHINISSLTPMKMALMLLDHLFTKDELAFSNISGKSRKGKNQLSPILIYGIKCHLEYKFRITDKDWYKICQNMDAKCRFLYKKRRKEIIDKQLLKLKVEEPNPLRKRKCISATTEEIGFEFDHLNGSDIDFNRCVKVITQSPCELRIINATPAQIAHLQESHEIILAEEMLPDSNDEKSILISNDSEVSMSTVVINGDDEGMTSHLTITSSNEVDSSKDEEESASHPMKVEHELVMNDHLEEGLHDHHLEEGLHLQVELDGRPDD